MGQASAKLRRFDTGYSHWCLGCRHLHVIYTSYAGKPQWTFDGNAERPTFAPAMKAENLGEETLCHYFLTAGQLVFLSDCRHDLAGRTVELPDLPEEYRDAGASG